MTVVAVPTEQGTTLVGEEAELWAHLSALVTAGRLRPEGLLSSGRTGDGRCFARVRLVDVAPKRRVRRPLVVGAVVAGVLVVASAAWAVVEAISWVAAHLSQIVGVGIVLVLVLLAASRGDCDVTVIHRRR